jgi:hypothetical protein
MASQDRKALADLMARLDLKAEWDLWATVGSQGKTDQMVELVTQGLVEK